MGFQLSIPERPEVGPMANINQVPQMARQVSLKMNSMYLSSLAGENNTLHWCSLL